MPVITLTSDYGLKDYRVAKIKGSIVSKDPNMQSIDISHEISSYNLLETSYIVRNAYTSFPKGSVHIISVDSFHHKDRKAVLYIANGHYFIAADNGVLSLIFFDIKPEDVYEITLNNRFDDQVDFPTIDIYVPSAIHLLKGGVPELIGRKYSDYKKLSFPRPKITDKQIVGEVMYIDHFGNAVTNITKNKLKKFLASSDNYSISFRSTKLKTIYNNYTDVVKVWEKETSYHGKAAAIYNDADLLELTVYKGYKENGASSLYGLSIGDHVMVYKED